MESLEKKLEDSNTDCPMEVCYDDYLWPNGTNVLVHKTDGSNKHTTYTCPKLLPPNFSITVKFVELYSKSHITIGVTDKILNEVGSKYLGGDYGSGNWGISGSGTVGEGGKWTSAKCIYQKGDTITFFGNNGVISFAVNGSYNSEYTFNVGSKNLYLAVTLYYADDTIEIYQETL
jgi:hypothetical protein